MSGWKPADSAPKDGTAMWLKAETAAWSPVLGWWSGEDKDFPWEFIMPDGSRNAYMLHVVTDWLPIEKLSPPPVAMGGKEE